MIKCNLSVLLAERSLKITQVSKDTGISRTTLTSLMSNGAQGVQFDTVNTLCMYLGVTPADLIKYIPLDFRTEKVTIASFEKQQLTAYIHIYNGQSDAVREVYGDFDFIKVGMSLSGIYVRLVYQLLTSDAVAPWDAVALQKMFLKQPPLFIADIKNELIEKLCALLLAEHHIRIPVDGMHRFEISILKND